jgi:hypothetical protein
LGATLIRESRLLRAVLLTTWFYSFLLWFYIAVRVITNDHILFDPFVYRVPWLSFAELGGYAFVLSSACMFIYLYIWGFRKNSPIG